MHRFSRKAPQHPNNAITKMIEPITIALIESVELVTCISDDKFCTFTCTRIPKIKRIEPHNCNKRKKNIMLHISCCIYVLPNFNN